MDGYTVHPLFFFKEERMADEQPRILTRRDLFKAAGLAGAAAVAVPAALISPEAAVEAAAPQAGAALHARDVFEHLTAAEADLVEAIADRLIPSDASGAGAKEARVVRYIDRALGGALASTRQAYTAGLTALDNFAQSSRGRPFLQLTASEQNAVLVACERGEAAGFSGSAQFFAMVLAHTRQGMFSDPYYGGNANFVGWDLIGYPGVRTTISGADQKKLEGEGLKPNHKSAYDFDTFVKASARADVHEFHEPAMNNYFDSEGGRSHGD
jgi:gluconate 2-dehydrogenase gamma chain